MNAYCRAHLQFLFSDTDISEVIASAVPVHHPGTMNTARVPLSFCCHYSYVYSCATASTAVAASCLLYFFISALHHDVL